MQNLLKDLETLLSKDSRFIADGKILKNAVIEHALKIDPALVKLLKSNPVIRKHFFVEVDDILVFDKVKFQDFVSNKQFLPNSYTSFKNRLGLTSGKEGLSENKDIVLAWAYKDCVLEGGMTKDEKKRNEIFYNTVLAPDEITRLLDPKVFTNFEYWDSEAVKKGKPKSVKDVYQSPNLLIKGNNLLALHCLKKKYAGKVKLIYIDPPFNTENDSFKYNDTFNHSTWLTFMKNRLEVAKSLLADDGVIFIHLDDNETAYLRIMMDEVFGKENYVNTITISTNMAFGYKSTASGLFKQAQFITFYAKEKRRLTLSKLFVEKEYDTAYNMVFEDIQKPENKWQWKKIDGVVAEKLGFSSTKDALKEMSKEDFQAQVALFALENAERVFQTAAVTGGAFKKRKLTIEKSHKDKDKIHRHPNDDMDYMFIGGRRVIFYKERLANVDGNIIPAEIVTDMWTDMSLEGLAKEGGIDFPRGKKPEKLIQRILQLATDKNDIVLDFFAGSGTTPAVAHKMERRWVAIEQMDYIKDLPEARIKNVIGGDSSGISKAVNWNGGGDFIYCEIMEWNERYAQMVHKAKNTAELLKVYSSMKEQAFFRYDIDLSAIEDKEFKGLDFKVQQKALLDCLEKNHLYVNFSEVDDKEYNVSDEDKKLTCQFYAKD